MVRIPTHPVRPAERDRAVRDARVRARVPERREPRVPIEHPVPDPRELRKCDCEPRPGRSTVEALALAGGVDPAREVVQAGEDGLDHRVARGGVRAAPVDVRDEKLARA